MDFPVFGRPWGDFCTYCRVDVFFVCVLLSLSIIVSVSCPFFFLASLSCLTILLVIDTHTHTQRPYKDTKGMHTYTGNVMLRRNLMGCRYSVKGSVWDRDYDFKPLMCGHADYNIFFFLNFPCHHLTVSFVRPVFINVFSLAKQNNSDFKLQ